MAVAPVRRIAAERGYAHQQTTASSCSTQIGYSTLLKWDFEVPLFKPFSQVCFFCSVLFCSVLFYPILSYCPFTMHLHTRQRLALRASILSTLLLTSPCEAYVNWLYPPSSSSNALAYNYNDVVYFTWDSNFTNPSLTLWCATDDNYFARESIRLSYPPVILTLQSPPSPSFTRRPLRGVN